MALLRLSLELIKRPEKHGAHVYVQGLSAIVTKPSRDPLNFLPRQVGESPFSASSDTRRIGIRSSLRFLLIITRTRIWSTRL